MMIEFRQYCESVIVSVADGRTSRQIAPLRLRLRSTVASINYGVPARMGHGPRGVEEGAG